MKIGDMLSKLDRWWNEKTGQYHWYQVRFVYSTKQGHKIFDYATEIGVRKKKTTLDRREIKKIEKPMHLQKPVKHMLCNGKLAVEFMCYLGRY